MSLLHKSLTVTLGRLVIRPIDPANQRIILKIVGFQHWLRRQRLWQGCMWHKDGQKCTFSHEERAGDWANEWLQIIVYEIVELQAVEYGVFGNLN